jgi:Flp pilus assembly pilin Flp
MEKKVKEIDWLNESGATTAEYAIITLAAVGFAGILLAILRSEEVKGMLLDLVRSALSVAGN